MARRLISVKYRVDGGPVVGGSGYELNVYNDEPLTTPSTLNQRGSGAGTQPNPMKPNAGMQSALLADRVAGDAFVTVNDVTGFQVGDLVPIYDGTNTVYRVITVITPGTKRLDLDSTLGVGFTVANGTLVGNEDMTGHIWFYVDDVRDYYAQPVEVASGRKLPPMLFPTAVPSTNINAQEEGVSTGVGRPAINFIGVTITAADDGANSRINVTVSAAPDSASFVTTAAEANLSNEKVLGTAVTMRGTIGARPAASIDGRTYSSTDEVPPTHYRDTGSAWEAYGFRDPLTTRGDVIVRGSTGTTRLALGATTRVLTSDGTDAVWSLPSSALDRQLFTAGGTWTKPANAKLICAIAIAGGGGGEGGHSGASQAGGGGGGAGAYVCRFIDASAAGATETVTIGAAGTAGATAGGNGGNGGNTSLGALAVAYGGAGGGTGAASQGGGGGGSGGAGSGTTGGKPGTGSGAASGGEGSNGGAAVTVGGVAEFGGAGGGGAGGVNQGGAAGGSSIFGAGAGGGGGGNADGGAGGAGGAHNSYTAGGGGTAGTAGGPAGAGGNGGAGTARGGTGRCGDGGGAGGGSNNTAGTGAAGGIPGGGGGGGGAGNANGGVGGAGARGELFVFTWS